MMKAAQQGGGGGGGQHGSLLAGGTALPGGPSPQPGQPGSLMQGGKYILMLLTKWIILYDSIDHFEKSILDLSILIRSRDRSV